MNECKHKEKCIFYEAISDNVMHIDSKNSMEGRSRAFWNKDTDYYVLLRDFGPAKKGTIFYYDPDDSIRGSIANGCLKLAWAFDGNCQCNPGLCADTISLHAEFRHFRSIFMKVCSQKEADEWATR